MRNLFLCFLCGLAFSLQAVAAPEPLLHDTPLHLPGVTALAPLNGHLDNRFVPRTATGTLTCRSARRASPNVAALTKQPFERERN